MTLAALMLVTLVWRPNNEPDLAGYNIYYGVTNATYTNKVTLGLVTTNELHGLVPNVTYFCAVTAVNSSGAESDFSNEISWRQPGPTLIETRCEDMTFSWETIPGAVYRVTCTKDLSVSWYGWLDLTGDMVATGETMEWSEPFSERERFYRVAVLVPQN